MRFHKGRCLYIAVAVVVLHIIIFSIVSSGPTFPTLDRFNYDFASLAHVFRPREAYSFNAWADKLFDRVVKDSDAKMAQFALQKPPAETIRVPQYVDNPHMYPFDPRLTLGMYLHDIRNQLQTGTPASQLFFSTFHWADWTDLSILHGSMFGKEKLQCADLNSVEVGRRRQQDVLDPDKFCMDDEGIENLAQSPDTDPAIKPYLERILQSPRTGFHVHKHPGRSNHLNMRLSSASYVQDFMPAPLGVVMLFPGEKIRSLRIDVKQDVLGRVRLADTGPNVTEVLVSHEIKKISLFLPQNRQEMAAEVSLDVSRFQDPLERVVKELLAQNSLSLQEVNYFNSVALSLETSKVPKYFFEAKLIRSVKNWALGGHYDWRFFKGLINSSDLQLPVLHGLLSAWLRFTAANNLNTWVAHGLLLLWFWNGMVFPWDADIDVQMPISDLHALARDFNQTIIVDFGADIDGVRHGRYFVDCATWISHRSKESGLNFIDARFVDMDSGLYIDITGLAVSNTMASERYDPQLPAKYARQYEGRDKKTQKPIRVSDEQEVQRNTAVGLVNCRNDHFVRVSEISPLSLTYMEGVPAYVPHAFIDIIQSEYGPKSLEAKRYRSFAFLPRLRLWQNSNQVHKYIKTTSKENRLDLGADTDAAHANVDKVAIFSFSDRDYLLLMASEPSVLVEYLVTRDVTALHEEEMALRIRGKSTKSLFLKKGRLRHHFGLLRHDFTNYQHKKYDFNLDERVVKMQNDYDAFRLGNSVQKKTTDDVVVPVNTKQETKIIDTQAPGMAQDAGVTRPDRGGTKPGKR